MLKHTKNQGIQKSRLAVILLGAVLAVGIAVLLMGIGGTTGEYGTFIKNGELFYTDGTADNTFQLTVNLMDSEELEYLDDLETFEEPRYVMESEFGEAVCVSQKGDRVFFPDKLDEGDYGFPLYCRDLTRPEKAAVKVGSDVTQYAINDAGTEVLYLDGSNGVFYLSGLESKERLGAGVEGFAYTENFKKVVFWDKNGNYYQYTPGKAPVCIAQGITDVEFTASDLSWFCYRKNGDLYVQNENETEGTRIAEDVAEVLKIYETGEIYYRTEEAAAEERTLMDFVVDDLAEADAQAENSEEKDWRDELRLDLSQTPAGINGMALWFYDGHGQTARVHGVANYGITFSETAPIAVFEAYYEGEAPETILLSEVSDDTETGAIWDAEYNVRSNTDAGSCNYYCIGTEVYEIDADDVQNASFTPDNSVIYFSDYWGSQLVYTQFLPDNGMGTYICEGEYIGSFFSKDGKAYTATWDANGEGYTMCLYAGNTLIADNVYHYEYDEQNDRILYMTDLNEKRGYGTLNMYSNGKNTVIAYDIRQYTLTENGDIYYLSDYSLTRFQGNLYRYNEGDPVRVAEDVIVLSRTSQDRNFLESDYD